MEPPNESGGVADARTARLNPQYFSGPSRRFFEDEIVRREREERETRQAADKLNSERLKRHRDAWRQNAESAGLDIEADPETGGWRQRVDERGNPLFKEQDWTFRDEKDGPVEVRRDRYGRVEARAASVAPKKDTPDDPVLYYEDGRPGGHVDDILSMQNAPSHWRKAAEEWKGERTKILEENARKTLEDGVNAARGDKLRAKLRIDQEIAPKLSELRAQLELIETNPEFNKKAGAWWSREATPGAKELAAQHASISERISALNDEQIDLQAKIDPEGEYTMALDRATAERDLWRAETALGRHGDLLERRKALLRQQGVSEEKWANDPVLRQLEADRERMGARLSVAETAKRQAEEKRAAREASAKEAEAPAMEAAPKVLNLEDAFSRAEAFLAGDVPAEADVAENEGDPKTLRLPERVTAAANPKINEAGTGGNARIAEEANLFKTALKSAPKFFASGAQKIPQAGASLMSAGYKLYGKAAKTYFERIGIKDDVVSEFYANWADGMNASAEFWSDTADETTSTIPKNFQESLPGQFTQGASQLPMYLGLSGLGMVGTAVMGLSIASEADSEQRAIAKAEGEEFDPLAAAPVTLASAIPQLLLERFLGVEALFAKSAAKATTQGGKIGMRELAANFFREAKKGAVVEGITEPTQGLWGDIVASFTYDEERNPLDARQRFTEALLGATLGALGGGGVQSLNDVPRVFQKSAEAEMEVLRRTARAIEVRSAADSFAELTDAAKIEGEDGDKAREVLELVGGNLKVERFAEFAASEAASIRSGKPREGGEFSGDVLESARELQKRIALSSEVMEQVDASALTSSALQGDAEGMQAERDVARALVKIANGNTNLSTPEAERLNALGQFLGTQLVRDHEGVQVITDTARDWLAKRAPAAKKLIAKTEAEMVADIDDAIARQTPNAEAAPNVEADPKAKQVDAEPAAPKPAAGSSIVSFSTLDGRDLGVRIAADARTAKGAKVTKANAAEYLSEQGYEVRKVLGFRTEKAAPAPAPKQEPPEAPAQAQAAPVQEQVEPAAEPTSATAVRGPVNPGQILKAMRSRNPEGKATKTMADAAVSISRGVNEAVAKFDRVFGEGNVRVEKVERGSGGVYLDGDGKLVISIGDLIADGKVLSAKPKRIEKLVQEEAIHYVAKQVLEGEEVVSMWNGLPEPTKENVRKAYGEGDDFAMGHEFIRMVVQGRIAVKGGKLTSDGAAISEDLSGSGVLERIADALRKIRDYFTDLGGRLKADGADASTIKTVEDYVSQVESLYEAVMEEAKTDGATPTDSDTDTQERATPEAAGRNDDAARGDAEPEAGAEARPEPAAANDAQTGPELKQEPEEAPVNEGDEDVYRMADGTPIRYRFRFAEESEVVEDPRNTKPGMEAKATRDFVAARSGEKFNPSWAFAIDPTFQQGPPMVEVEDGKLVIKGGHRRTFIRRQSRKQYEAALPKYAKRFGLDMRAAEGMKAPTIVAEIIDPIKSEEQRDALIQELNASTQQGTTSAWNATTIARRMPDDIIETAGALFEKHPDKTPLAALQMVDARELATQLIQRKILTDVEAKTYVGADGVFTKAGSGDGAQVLKKALAATIIDDPRTLDRIEDTPLETKVLNAIGKLITLRSRGQDMAVVRRAIAQEAERLQMSPTPNVRDFQAQEDFNFDGDGRSPEADAIQRWLSKVSSQKSRQEFQKLIDEFAPNEDVNQTGLFGEQNRDIGEGLLLRDAEALMSARGMVTPTQDADYLKAVESGDMETAQRMVDEAAKEAGYDVGPVYHGTSNLGGKRFDVFKGLAWFTENEQDAQGFAEASLPEWTPFVIRAYLKPGLVQEFRNRDAAKQFLEQTPWFSELVKAGIPSGLPNTFRVQGKPWWIVASPNQIKSADPVTYDAAGNVIPLSQRFNPDSDSILYSRRAEDENQLSLNLGEATPTDAEADAQNAPIPFEGQSTNRDDLLVDNLGLAASIAMKYHQSMKHVDVGDLIQEARIALLRATKKYNPEQGPFAPYAARVIRNRMTDIYRRNPHVEQVYLDARMDDGSETTGDRMEDESAPDIRAKAQQSETATVLSELVGKLPDIPRMIVERHAAGDTFEMIGEELGITRQAVAKRWTNALDLLRKQLAARGVLGQEGGVLMSARGEDELEAMLSRRADDIAIKEAMDWLNEVTPDKDQSLITKAMDEKPGERTIGRSDLANLAESDEGRGFVSGMDEAMKDEAERQSHEQWEEEARAMIAGDRRGTVLRLLETAQDPRYNGLTDAVDVKAAQILVAELVEEAARTRNPDTMRQAQILTYAYRKNRTEQARALAAGRDPHRTPQERHREFLATVIFTPSRRAQKRIDEALKPAQKSKRIRDLLAQIELAKLDDGASKGEIARLEKALANTRAEPDSSELFDEEMKGRMAKIEAALSSMGVTLEDIFRGEAEVALKKDNILGNYSKVLDEKRKQAVRMFSEGRTNAEIKKATGLSFGELNDLNADFMREYEERHFAKYLAKAKDLVSEAKSEEDQEVFDFINSGILKSAPGDLSEGKARELARKAMMADLARMGFGDGRRMAERRKKSGLGKPKPQKPKAVVRPAQKPKGQSIPGIEYVWEIDNPKPGDIHYPSPMQRDLGDPNNPPSVVGGEAPGKALKPFTVGPDAPTAFDYGEGGKGKVLKPFTVGPDAPPKIDIADPVQAVKVARVLSTALDGNKFDMAYEWWINSILSGPQTHVANITGNSLNAAVDMTIQRAAEAAVNGALGLVGKGDPNAAQFGEFRHMIRGIMPGIVDGAKAAVQTWGSEVGLFESRVLNSQMEIGNMGKLENYKIAIPGAAGRFVRLPGRALMATDEFFKGAIARIQVGAEAYRIAKGEGLTGEAMETRIRGLVNMAGSVAWQRAAERAVELTFQTDPEGGTAGGVAYEAFAGFRNAVPGMRYVIPFLRTIINIFSTGVRKSPLGSINFAARFARHGLYSIGNKGVMAKPYPQALAIRHFAEQLLAWPAAAFLFGAMEGDDDDDEKFILITGSRPRATTDYGVSKLYNRVGLPAYAVRVGNTMFQYGRYEPVSTALGITADSIRSMKQGARMSGSELFGRVLDAISTNLTDKTFASGPSQVVGIIDDPARNAANWASDFLVSWVPNVIRQPMRIADPYVREHSFDSKASDFIPRFMERTMENALPIPGQRAVEIDIWGNEVKKEGNLVSRLIVPQRAGQSPRINRADRTLLAWNRQNPADQYAPPPPSRRYEIDGEAFYMNDEEYVEFQKAAGKKAWTLIQRVPLNTAEPTERDINRIRNAVSNGREAAKREFIRRKRLEMARSGR